MGAPPVTRSSDRRRRPGAGATLPLAGLGYGHRHDLPGGRRACRRTIQPGNAAIEWLLSKEVRHPGDWQIRRPGLEPTGWHFQFHNAFYPDLDDTAMVLLGLKRSPLANEPATLAAIGRGVDWLLSMQNRDGGWAAYDVDIDNQVLTKLPFADHNAMLDPSCADITARVIELLGTLGYRVGSPFDSACPRVPLSHPGARGLLVRALGGQLHLRHMAGVAGALCDRVPDGSPRDREGRALARINPAGFRSLGRNVPELRRAGAQGHRRADPIADGLGDAGPDRRRQGRARRPSSAGSSI